MELFGFSLILHNNDGFVSWPGLNLEGPVLGVILNNFLTEFTSNKTFSIKDRVLGVSCNLVLCGISNQSFFLSESDIRWGGVVSLIVGDDFDLVVHPNTNA